MEKLFKMELDFGRQGEIEGVFYSTDERVNAIEGKDLRFGEALGKHSNVSCSLDAGDIELVTDNKEFLDMAKDLGINLESGTNPFWYYTCDDCGGIKDVITNKCHGCDK
jgi:hypothetical protein